MNFKTGNSSPGKEEQAISQSEELLPFSNLEKDTARPANTDEEKKFEDLHETVCQITNFTKTKDFSSMLSTFKNLETYSKSISKGQQSGIHPRFYIRCLVELEDCIHEVWDKRKILDKQNRQDLDSVRKKLGKISKTLAHDLAKYRENPDPDRCDEYREESESKEFKSEIEHIDMEDEDICFLPSHNPKVDTSDDEILKNSSTTFTKKQAKKNPKYVDKALDLVELEDCVLEVCGSGKVLNKANRLNTVSKKFQKISGISAYELATHFENRALPDEYGENEYNASESENYDIYQSTSKRSTSKRSTPKRSTSKRSTSKRSKRKVSSKMIKPTLPYDPQVDTFGDRILKIGSIKLTYEQAYKNPKYVNEALKLKNSSDTRTPAIPIEFTQFVLRKMAVGSELCSTFEAAIHPEAKKYLLELIGSTHSEVRQVHPANPDEPPSLFRSQFTKLFCKKVISNLKDTDCECDRIDKLARIFPFKICKNVPQYEIDILNNFDDRFYHRMQRFLDEHFDHKVLVRETTALFLKNIRHFFDTTVPSKRKKQSAPYLKQLRSLNDEGIIYFQNFYRDYRNVRKYFKCTRRVPHLDYENEDIRNIPQKNIDEMASLLKLTEFLTKPEIYADVFKKYLFFFVHALQVEEDPTPVFFIDDVLFQCMKSLRRFRTLNQDINIVDDIASITMLSLFGHKSGFYNLDDNLRDSDCYSIDLTTLQNIKEYITTFVSDENHNVRVDVKYQAELYCELPFRVNKTICFDVCYTSKNNNCQAGIMNFLRQLICSVLFPDDDPIKHIVCYSAYLGQEHRFTIPVGIVQSVRNFVRLSTLRNNSEASWRPEKNVYSSLLRGYLK